MRSAGAPCAARFLNTRTIISQKLIRSQQRAKTSLDNSAASLSKHPQSPAKTSTKPSSTSSAKSDVITRKCRATELVHPRTHRVGNWRWTARKSQRAVDAVPSCRCGWVRPTERGRLVWMLIARCWHIDAWRDGEEYWTWKILVAAVVWKTWEIIWCEVWHTAASLCDNCTGIEKRRSFYPSGKSVDTTNILVEVDLMSDVCLFFSLFLEMDCIWHDLLFHHGIPFASLTLREFFTDKIGRWISFSLPTPLYHTVFSFSVFFGSYSNLFIAYLFIVRLVGESFPYPPVMYFSVVLALRWGFGLYVSCFLSYAFFLSVNYSWW